MWKGGSETQLEDGRGHSVTVDLPADEGGQNAGTSALELGVLSLAGCITTIFGLVAKKRRLAFTGLTISLTAERPPGAPTIERVHGKIELQTGASKEDVETILRLTVKTCPVGVIFERARIPVDVTVTILPPSPLKSHPSPGQPNAGSE
ncbi:MAG: OsmC family protein [Thermoplasmata archaeon]